jgi:hypothetical protein
MAVAKNSPGSADGSFGPVLIFAKSGRTPYLAGCRFHRFTVLIMGNLDLAPIAIVLVALGACAPTWSNTASATEIAAIGSLACDGGQTQQVLAHADQAGLRERNIVLGDHPSNEALWTYLGAIAFGVVVANKVLPPRVAVIVNAAILTAETHAIVTNAYYGSSLACGIGSWDEQTAEHRTRDTQTRQPGDRP